MSEQLIVGMLSGTSRDGVDAVLINFGHDSMEVLHAVCTPYPPAIKSSLDQLLETGQAPTPELTELLDENLGRFFARTAQNLVADTGMEMSDIQAIGSHGQTVWHQPGGDNPVSIQLGKPDLIASNTGVCVVANFRAADIQAGGQGAPLAPLLHQQLFCSEDEDRAVLNLGGIANLSLLPSKGGVSGFDCGPGNCLMDAWTNRHLHKDYDDNGGWAAKGTSVAGLLEKLLKDPYFSQSSPKSTGLEYFNMPWLDNMLGDTAMEPVDVQATLVDLTVMSVAASLRDVGIPKRLLVCGGGANNKYLMSRLAAALPRVIIESTARHGIDPNWVEGLLFAWLARARLTGQLQNTPPITGAAQPVMLGDIHLAPES